MAAPGSELLAEIYGTKYVSKKNNLYHMALRVLKEEMHFLLDFKENARGEINRFVQEQGFRLGDTHIMGRKLGARMAVVGVLL